MQNNVRVIEEKVLSNNWYLLKTTTFDLLRRDGTWQRQQRETYDRGNGATILLYNRAKQTIILTRQFRFPTFGVHSMDRCPSSGDVCRFKGHTYLLHLYSSHHMFACSHSSSNTK